MDVRPPVADEPPEPARDRDADEPELPAEPAAPSEPLPEPPPEQAAPSEPPTDADAPIWPSTDAEPLHEQAADDFAPQWPDALDPSAPAFDDAGVPVPARSFAPGLDDAAVGVSVVAPTAGPACGWCGKPLPAPDAEACPSCGAALQPVPDLPDIPGVTMSPPDVRRAVRDVSPEIAALVAPPISDEIARVGSRPELSPPDRSTRLAMLELELQALRAEAAARAAEEAAEEASEAEDGGPGTGVVPPREDPPAEGR